MEAWIAGEQQSNHVVNRGQAIRVQYPGMNNGPLRVSSNNGVSVMAAERVIYKVNNVNTSFSEMMALPNVQLNPIFWLPLYNNVDLDSQVRFALP